MANNEIVFLSREQARAMLPDGDTVHTFRGAIVPVGADWPRQKILDAIERYQFELTGPMATAMGHGMGFSDEHGQVFVATKPAPAGGEARP